MNTDTMLRRAESIRADMTAENQRRRIANLSRSLVDAERWTLNTARQYEAEAGAWDIRDMAERTTRHLFRGVETFREALADVDVLDVLSDITPDSARVTPARARSAMDRIAHTISQLAVIQSEADAWLTTVPFHDVVARYGANARAFWHLAHASHAATDAFAEQYVPVLLAAWYVCPLRAEALADALRVRCLITTYVVRVAVRSANAERWDCGDIGGRQHGRALREALRAGTALAVLDDARAPSRIRRAERGHGAATNMSHTADRFVAELIESGACDASTCPPSAQHVRQIVRTISGAYTAYAGAVIEAERAHDASTDASADAVTVACFARAALEAHDSATGHESGAMLALSRLEAERNRSASARL